MLVKLIRYFTKFIRKSFSEVSHCIQIAKSVNFAVRVLCISHQACIISTTLPASRATGDGFSFSQSLKTQFLTMKCLQTLVFLSKKHKKTFSFIDFLCLSKIAFFKNSIWKNIPQTRANCIKAIASQKKRIKFEHVQKLYKPRDRKMNGNVFNKKESIKRNSNPRLSVFEKGLRKT